MDRRVNDGDRYRKERLEEIDYALEELHQQPWADQQRIVLSGQSQGAIALADYHGGGFSAAILTGFNCKYGTYHIAIDKSVPVLSLQDPKDPAYMGGKRGVTGTCADELKGRDRSYVVEMPGFGHAFLGKKEAKEQILKFLAELRLLKR